MKKFLFKSLSVFMAFVLLVAQSHVLSAKTISAGIPSMEESVFTLDENALDVALSELNELDNYLAQNDGVTYADLEAAGSELITSISDIAAPMGMAQDGDPLLGIPAFWWGCVLGWVGWLLVYVLTDKDRVQTKQAFNGCLISSAIGVAFSVVYWVVLADALY
jgi:hypothetical protein